MTRRVVIIPAFDEAASIGRVLTELRRHLRPEDAIVVIDDGSLDNTGDAARAALATVLRHEKNQGYGQALHTGYVWARKQDADVVAQMDADGQHDAGFIPRLFEAIERGEAEVAVGSRFLDPSLGGTYRAGLLRRSAMRLLAALASRSLGHRVTDPTSGFRAFARSALPLLTSPIFPGEFPDADALILLHRHGFRVREVPVPMYTKAGGKSIHSGIGPLLYAIKMIPALWRALRCVPRMELQRPKPNDRCRYY